MRRTLSLLALSALLLTGCGDPPTAAGSEILAAQVSDDLPEEQRKALVGLLTMPAATVTFPDGKGSVSVEVLAARMAKKEGDSMHVDPSAEPGYLRNIAVKVSDAAGYQISAELIGSPENLGTEAAPVHARLVQVTRRKGSVAGSSMAQMTLRVSPRGVERL